MGMALIPAKHRGAVEVQVCYTGCYHVSHNTTRAGYARGRC